MKRWIRYSLIGTCLLGLLGFGITRWLRAPLQVLTRSGLPQLEEIQVYMNQNQAATFTEPYRDQTRIGDDLEQIIVDRIQAAQSTVDVAVQELRSPRIAQALRDRHIAGVKVRLVLENTYSQPLSQITAGEIAQLNDRQRHRYQENLLLLDRDRNGQVSSDEAVNNDALLVIQDAGIPWLDDTADESVGSGLMHHKFVVLDRQTVIATSANFTPSDLHGDLSTPTSRGNANSLLVIDNVPLAQLFTQEFNLLWGDGPGGLADSLFGVNKPFRPAQKVIIGDATVWVQFSPSSSTVPWAASSNGLIARMLSQANAQIDLALFVFSEQPLADVLEQQHNEGVEIRALIDPQFAYQNYSEALDLLGVALSRRNAPCTAEGNNRPWSEPIPGVGVPQLPEGDLLHHKYGVVDQTLVIIGSHNWSAAANQRNDETLLAIDHPTVAAHYQREFDRLYANSYLGIPDFLQEKLDTQDQECSTLTTPTQTASPSPLLSKQSTSSPEVAAPEGTAPVNLNTATQTELERLPGIGPKLAERIIVARQAKPFTSFADLDQVPGIGPKLLEELTNQVTW